MGLPENIVNPAPDTFLAKMLFAVASQHSATLLRVHYPVTVYLSRAISSISGFDYQVTSGFKERGELLLITSDGEKWPRPGWTDPQRSLAAVVRGLPHKLPVNRLSEPLSKLKGGTQLGTFVAAMQSIKVTIVCALECDDGGRQGLVSGVCAPGFYDGLSPECVTLLSGLSC